MTDVASKLFEICLFFFQELGIVSRRQVVNLFYYSDRQCLRLTNSSTSNYNKPYQVKLMLKLRSL